MTRDHIYELLIQYEELFKKFNIPVERMDPTFTFRKLFVCDYHAGNVQFVYILSHAHYLCKELRKMVYTGSEGKINRHLASIQMCMSFAGWFTLEQLMEHNKPKGISDETPYL